MKEILIYGAGGLGREVACLIDRLNDVKQAWNLIGFVDDLVPAGTKTEYGEVLGGNDFINHYKKDLSVVFAIGNSSDIHKLAGAINNSNVEFPNLIDPSVLFLDPQNFQLGKGNIICAKCVVSCHVKMGDFNILNIGTGIGHDVTMGNCNVMMPNVNISGGVEIGNNNFFGVKSTVLQYLKVNNNTTLGAHSLLMHNAKEAGLYFGNPAIRTEF